MMLLLACLLIPPLNQGLSIPLQTNSASPTHTFPHKTKSERFWLLSSGAHFQKPLSTCSVGANIRALSAFGALKHRTRLPVPHRKSWRPMEKAPGEASTPRSHRISRRLRQQLPGTGKYSSSARSFHHETKSSTLLRLKQITKETFIYFYWTGVVEQKNLH